MTVRNRLVASLFPSGVTILAAMLSLGCPGTLQDPERFADGSAAALATVAADGADDADGAVAGSCPDVPQLLVTTCGTTAGCHTSNEKVQGLDLQSPDPAARLVGVSSTEGPGLLVDPANPPKSVLYTKLTARPPFGVRMPFNRPALDDATLACVLDWVTSAAGDGGMAGTGTPPGTGDPGDAGSAVDAGTDVPTTTDAGGSTDTPSDAAGDQPATPDASPGPDASTDDAPAD